MQHSFDVSIAEKYGVFEAIFLNNIAFWIAKNKANNKHFYEGRYWTYNTSKALAELFPYWSDDQIDRLIKKCKSSGLLLTNNFNETTYDRTRWFGLTDIALEMFNIAIPQNRGMDSATSREPFREIAEPIPDSKPDKKHKEREARQDRALPLPDDFVEMLNQRVDEFEKAVEHLQLSHQEKSEEVKKFIVYAKSHEWKRKDWINSLVLWMARARDYKKLTKDNYGHKKNEAKHNEARCAVPEWGPGHAGWESIHARQA